MNAPLRLVTGLFALVMALSAGPRAEAAIVTLGYHVTATTASISSGSVPAPFLPFTLDFSLTFDDAVGFNNRTDGIVFDLHGYPLGAAFAVSYVSENLVVGATPTNSAVGGNNDFLLIIANAADPDLASVSALFFTLAAFPESLWQATDAVLTVTDLSAPAGVPAPAIQQGRLTRIAHGRRDGRGDRRKRASPRTRKGVGHGSVRSGGV